MEQQWIDANPAEGLESPSHKKSLPRVLDEQEMSRLISVVINDQTPEGIRMTALLEMLYATGLRVSELLTLPYRCVFHPTKGVQETFIIMGKGNKERLVCLTPNVMEALTHYNTVRPLFIRSIKGQEYLFPSKSSVEGHITRQRLGQLLKHVAVSANIDINKVSPHIIRHTFATHLLRHGADLLTLQKLLGHADISTTQIYTHVACDQLVNLVMNHHPLAHNK